MFAVSTDPLAKVSGAIFSEKSERDVARRHTTLK